MSIEAVCSQAKPIQCALRKGTTLLRRSDANKKGTRPLCSLRRALQGHACLNSAHPRYRRRGFTASSAYLRAPYEHVNTNQLWVGSSEALLGAAITAQSLQHKCCKALTPQAGAEKENESSCCLWRNMLGVGHSLFTLWYRNHKPRKVWSPVSYSFVCDGQIAGAQ